jgi:uncharacterized protein YxjI
MNPYQQAPYPYQDQQQQQYYPQQQQYNIQPPMMMNSGGYSSNTSMPAVYHDQQRYPMATQQPQHKQFTTTTVSSTGSLIDYVFAPNDRVLVKQKLENLEILTGWETENAYSVKFGNGIRGYAQEKSHAAWRSFLEASRPFKIHINIQDPRTNQLVHLMTIKRPYKFIGGLLDIKDGNHNPLGSVKKKFSITSRKFIVVDTTGRELYSLKASHVVGRSFAVCDLRNGEREVGQIKKQWSGLLQEMYSDADNFGIQFPASATPNEKALLFAATFLIDFMYFEQNQSRQF